MDSLCIKQTVCKVLNRFQHGEYLVAYVLNIRGLAEIIVPVRGIGRHSPNQVMIERECKTDEVLLSFS